MTRNDIVDMRDRWEPVFFGKGVDLTIEPDDGRDGAESIRNSSWYSFRPQASGTVDAGPAEDVADDIRQIVALLSVDVPEEKRGFLVRDTRALGERVMRDKLGSTYLHEDLDDYDDFFRKQVAPGIVARNWDAGSGFCSDDGHYFGSNSLRNFVNHLGDWIAEPENPVLKGNAKVAGVDAVAHLDAFARLHQETDGGMKVYRKRMKQAFDRTVKSGSPMVRLIAMSDDGCRVVGDMRQADGAVFMTPEEVSRTIDAYGPEHLETAFSAMVEAHMARLDGDVWRISTVKDGEEHVFHVFGSRNVDDCLRSLADSFDEGMGMGMQ